MQSRTLALTLLTFSLGACSSSSDGDSDASDEKLAARIQLESALRDGQATDSVASQPGSLPPSAGQTTPVASDVCSDNAWYGDGECDAWCPQGDAKDCAPNGYAIACAAFFSPADGFCDRKDPCGPLQDEDCAKPADPGTGGTGCAPDQPLPSPGGDGKCEPKTFAELKADPDCAMLACPAIFSPADGVCNAKNACDFIIDEDCARPVDGGGSSGVVCIDIAYAANGKCEAAPGCEANDPKDCKAPVACILILYEKNGKCEAAPGCEGSDPDC